MTALQKVIKRMQDYDGEAIKITSKSDIRLCKGEKLIAFPGLNSDSLIGDSLIGLETSLSVETTTQSLEYVYDFCEENGHALWCWFIKEPDDVDSYWYFELEFNKTSTPAGLPISSPALEKEVNALIDAGLYADADALMIDALEKLINTKKESRLDAATLLYREGKVTLARAAELAGIHRFEFEAALDAKGIAKLIEVDSAEALQDGVSFIKSLHESNEPTEGV